MMFAAKFCCRQIILPVIDDKNLCTQFYLCVFSDNYIHLFLELEICFGEDMCNLLTYLRFIDIIFLMFQCVNCLVSC